MKKEITLDGLVTKVQRAIVDEKTPVDVLRVAVECSRDYIANPKASAILDLAVKFATGTEKA